MASSRRTVVNKRLANKVIWSLEDIIALCKNAQGDWESAMVQAERRMDPIMLLALAKMRDHFAQIERLAKAARGGQYEGDQSWNGKQR